MHYYLVPCALQRHVRQTMQYVVILTQVDMHLGQPEDVIFGDHLCLSVRKHKVWVLIFCSRLKGTFWYQIYCVFSRNFHFCTSSSSCFSVGSQTLYAASSHMYMTSFINICDVKSADNHYVCKIVNAKKKITFCFEYDMHFTLSNPRAT